MTENKFDLEAYLANGVEILVKDILRASLSNPKESVFMTKFMRASKKATAKRHESEKNGQHVPPFLIASITSRCNLHCAGCYSRANDACNDKTPVQQMDGEAWEKVFTEARDLGISFILLAGGEPLLRKDVIEKAAKIPEILFPIFTNGTMIKEEFLTLFEKHRNLFPVLSIEGDEKRTDTRRGEGVYRMLNDTMTIMTENKVLYGVSITVTRENLEEVLSDKYVEELAGKGCKMMFYIEYVPADKDTTELALGDEERTLMDEKLKDLRGKNNGMIFLSFPGDEKSAGGCLATGRGFFHINSHGGAEPCPFSPYSDVNVKDVGVIGALKSGLFEALRASGLQSEEHNGGCALFDKSEKIKELLQSLKN